MLDGHLCSTVVPQYIVEETEATMVTPKRKRPETIKVMATVSEKRDLRRAADKAGVPLSVWLRATGLEKARASSDTQAA